MVKKRLVVVVISLVMISVGNFLYVYLGGYNLLGGYYNKNKLELICYYCGGYLVY